MADAAAMFMRHTKIFTEVLGKQMEKSKAEGMTPEGIKYASDIAVKLYCACIIAEAISNGFIEMEQEVSKEKK